MLEVPIMVLMKCDNFSLNPFDICCPVCGCINFSQYEVGQISCDKCDFVDIAEI